MVCIEFWFREFWFEWSFVDGGGVFPRVSAAFPGQGINGISEVVVSCLVFTGVDKVIVCRGVYNCLVLAREI